MPLASEYALLKASHFTFIFPNFVVEPREMDGSVHNIVVQRMRTSRALLITSTCQNADQKRDEIFLYSYLSRIPFYYTNVSARGAP